MKRQNFNINIIISVPKQLQCGEEIVKINYLNAYNRSLGNSHSLKRCYRDKPFN